jgi:hypothetical protein
LHARIRRYPLAQLNGDVELANLDETTQSKFEEMYGRIRWRFGNGTFQVIYPEQASHPSSYSVREWESGEPELLIDGASYRISRTEAGFCVEVPFDTPESKPAGYPSIECFKRYGA